MAKRGSGGASSDAKKRSRKAAAADDGDVDEVPADGVMPEDMEGPETIDDETARSDARAAVGDADEEEDEAEYRQPMEARRRHARSLSRVANPLVRPRALPDLDGVWDAGCAQGDDDDDDDDDDDGDDNDDEDDDEDHVQTFRRKPINAKGAPHGFTRLGSCRFKSRAQPPPAPPFFPPTLAPLSQAKPRRRASSMISTARTSCATRSSR